MDDLTTGSRQHQAVLRGYVQRLYDLAGNLDDESLGTPGLLSEEGDLKDLLDGLRGTLLPHMDALEVAVVPTLSRITAGHPAGAPMAHEHHDMRRLVDQIGAVVDQPEGDLDRYSVLSLRRAMLRLHVLLRTHLDEEDLYLPILEGPLSPEAEAELGRALDHLAAARM